MTQITVTTLVEAAIEHVWECWTNPDHIMEWNHASDDWHCPAATNDLTVGGAFSSTMSANDGSASFDFEGTYTDIVEYERIEYSLADDRHISVTFEEEDDKIRVTEVFDAEGENPIEMQQAGWQAILDNFRDYAEASI
ncbi:SRPBCC family protein [Candidatus Gracilibacteria bacterium]|jgi:uncharacterized protein YndB with AHSA1/START domain|nr:SRPBCC family protein [Candidatus Gracilibacteria bacterium]